jgi:hypothetical protein
LGAQLWATEEYRQEHQGNALVRSACKLAVSIEMTVDSSSSEAKLELIAASSALAVSRTAAVIAAVVAAVHKLDVHIHAHTVCIP